jgi:hypothetical protein
VQPVALSQNGPVERLLPADKTRDEPSTIAVAWYQFACGAAIAFFFRQESAPGSVALFQSRGIPDNENE